ncbi:MAG: S8 family serine peptidase [Parvimonas sp.]|uniref:S8 family serine peptidase n=1 Tax=Parvimonas sp. TaxID=1944660 RepID=UPI0025F4351D|nr:S8 family serine peptidase [Parvimonas sp.]MCI5996829.1 S8 family serine peptidase [Parvimonas sp.]
MKKIFSFLLAFYMIMSVIVLKNFSVANEETVKIVVFIDVSKLTDKNVESFLDNGDFDELKKINEIALNDAKSKMEGLIGKFEELSRDNFLMPFISLNATKYQVDKLTKADFVKNIEQDVDYKVNLKPNIVRRRARSAMYSANIIGIDDEFLKKYDGRGESVAVIDANFDPKHEVFKLDEGVKPSVDKSDIEKLLQHNLETFGNVKVEDVYINSKIPLAFHYMNKSTNLNPENVEKGHGQHVSATAVGNNGVVDGKYKWRGVAPNAQLFMMNCFANEGTSATYYIKAISDAVYLRASAINMSLGGTKGTVKTYTTADKSVAKIIDIASRLGTNVVIAGGNEGKYEGDISVDTPDIGTIGSPGIQQSAITVASMENSEFLANYLNFENHKLIYQEVDKRNFDKKSYSFVNCKEGLKDEDFSSVKGKVALIKRGGDTFNNKIARAEKSGAIGVMIYNNVLGNFSIGVDDSTKIPVIGLYMTDGEMLAEKSYGTINITGEKDIVKNPLEGEISDFSNWGVTSDGILKPDITAPGGNIYSAQNSKGFTEMSGTSMATPHVSGAVSLLSQSLKSKDEFKNLSTAKRGELIKTLLMNSAKPTFDKVNKVPVSPRRQGAGVVDMKSATELDFTVVDAKTNVASVFIDNINDSISLNLKIRNYSNQNKKLVPSVVVTVDEHDKKKNLLRPTELFSETLKETVEVPSNSEVVKKFSIPLKNVEKLKEFENGAFVEGFLTLSSQDGKKANFPFVSFKGDFKNLSIIEKPVYEFDFSKENPMFWNLKPTANAWHRFMTHIESKINEKPVILGMSNFNEIDEIKKQQKETDIKPVFDDKLVISPNGDGKLDEISLYSVFTRTANAGYEILDSNEKVVSKKDGKLFLKNISYWADKEDLDPRYLGYTNFDVESLHSKEDGEYILNIKGTPIVDGANEQTHSIKFVIDKTKPKFKDINLKENKLTFSVEDFSKLREIKAVGVVKKIIKTTPWPDYPEYVQEQEIEEETDLELKDLGDKKYELDLPDGIEKKNINITAVDLGYNSYSEDVDLMTTTEKLGKLKIVSKTKEGEEVPVKFEVYDSENKLVNNIDKLRKGKYTLEYKFCPVQYKGVDIKENYEFEITDENLEKVIEMNFEKVPIGQKMVLIRGTGYLTFDDFEIIATNLETNRKFVVAQEIKGTPQYFLQAPFGKYRLELKFKDNSKALKYDYEFSESENESSKGNTLDISVDEKSFENRVDLLFTENKYKVIPKTVGYDGEIDYIGMNLSVGHIVDASKVGRGKSEIVPKEIPEGYYVVPGMHEVSLDDVTPEKEVSFEYHKITDEDKFSLVIQDDAISKGITSKYKIYNFNERFNYPTGRVLLDYTSGMKLSPGWYCIEAQEESEDIKAQAKEPTPTMNLKEKVILVTEAKKGEVKVEFTWGKVSEGSITEKYNRSVEVNLPDDYPRNEIELVIKKDGLTVKNHIYRKDDPSTHSILFEQGVYDIEVKDLAKGYKSDVGKAYVFGSDGMPVRINITKVTIDGKDVKIKFVSDGTEVLNVKYKLDDFEFVKNEINVEKKVYKVEILSPESYVGKNITKEITVDENSNELTVELERLQKGTLDISFKFVDTADKSVKVKVNDKEISLTGKSIPFELGKYKVEIFDIDGQVGNFIVEPKVENVELSKQEPDKKVFFTIKRNPKTIDITELKKLVDEENTVLNSEKYRNSVDELQNNYKDAMKKAKKLIENEQNRTEFLVKKTADDIRIAKEALNGDKDFAKFVRKLKNLIKEKDLVIQSFEFINSDEDKQEEYLDSIFNAERLLEVNFETKELELAMKDILNARKDMGIKIKLETEVNKKKFEVESDDLLLGLKLVVVETEKEKFEILKKKDVDVYNIYFEDENKNLIELGEGNYKVTMSKRESAEVKDLYYVSSEGKLEKVLFEVGESTVTFTTNHFSVYALEYKVVEKTEDNRKDEQKDKTEKDNKKSDDAGKEKDRSNDENKNKSDTSDDNSKNDNRQDTKSEKDTKTEKGQTGLVQTALSSNAFVLSVLGLVSLAGIVISKKIKR